MFQGEMGGPAARPLRGHGRVHSRGEVFFELLGKLARDDLFRDDHRRPEPRRLQAGGGKGAADDNLDVRAQLSGDGQRLERLLLIGHRQRQRRGPFDPRLPKNILASNISLNDRHQ